MNPGRLFYRAGRILGVCAAGSLCLSASADPTPQGRLSNLTQCQWGMQCAGPCPAGTLPPRLDFIEYLESKECCYSFFVCLFLCKLGVVFFC